MTSRIKFSRKYFALPYAVLAVIFVVVPLFLLVYNAFLTNDGAFTFENFLAIFQKNEFDGSYTILKVLLRSFLIALATTVICLVLAYPTAMLLADTRINRWAILSMLFIMPMWINSLLRIYAVKLVFEDIIGQGLLLVIIGMSYDFFPFMLMPIYTILSSMDKSYYEAAQDLGASPFRKFVHVILPLSMPGVISGILMVFMPTISTFAVSDILGDAQNSWMFGNIINEQLSNGHYNTGSVYSLLMLVLIFGATFIADRLVRDKKSTAKGGK